jgi:hypothetical protein
VEVDLRFAEMKAVEAGYSATGTDFDVSWVAEGMM